ncbi:MAG: phosphoribosylformylglycinamidine synthase subunit PurQ [Bdellovibrionia bacterium]
MKILITRFLGTNCDYDIFNWVQARGHTPVWGWYQDQFDSKDVDAVIIPGGFSYGDYLRSGALAAKTPVMNSVREFARSGGPILGICNGFQILCESGLLPGVLLQNQSGRFIDNWQELNLISQNSFFTKEGSATKLRIPIAHGDGRYFVDNETLKLLEDKNQIWLKYRNNPNGSVADIAGVQSQSGRICGLMPHPERAYQKWMGSCDGEVFL